MTKLSNMLYRRFIFVLGIIATIAYRVIVVLNNYSSLWVQIAWYIGTIGFVWYFAHRFKIENRRDKLITDLNLVAKVKNCTALKDEDKKALEYVLRGLQTSLSKWNYIAIFLFSALALIYGILQDFILN
ncbi:MAG: hypothetical protein PHX76_01570 [Patescibacteria group bacterium]|jgi:hypothetical protein|nr:hypothetical protein [Patescibacteria group bacterium]MDD4443730.1 hypothetical protein [Patescibacteria group bacterium]NCU39667.1 hypothetical protein [Candidatus Falkowbacteria bacterium]